MRLTTVIARDIVSLEFTRLFGKVALFINKQIGGWI